MSLFALAAFGFTSKTFAAVDAFIWFKDFDGKTTKVQIQSDGSFTAPKLDPGTYTISISADLPASKPTGGSTNREASAPSVSEITVSFEVKTARDAQSGMATGKRQHVPPLKTTLSSSERLLPTVNKKLGSITIEANDGLTGKVTLNNIANKQVAYDTWQQQK